MKKVCYVILFVLVTNFCFAQKKDVVSIQVNKPVAEIQPTMWGLFFEDINFAADGGIYAELVKNRSFEFDNPMMAWKEVKTGSGKGRCQILNREHDNPNNPRYISLISESASGTFGLKNEGFRGMGVKKDLQYHFSVIARKVSGDAKLKIELLSSDNAKIGEASVVVSGSDWKKYEVSFKSTATDAKASLKVELEGIGALDLDMVSLFPSDTWKNRPNGLRSDLVQLLADVKPGFIRFPGGCIVEGRDLANRYQWKKTVGKVEERKVIVNRWNTEFKHRLTPDYFQSYGLGFFEYFLLSEDIGAEPLPIMNCGMACQYNTSEMVEVHQLEPYIQDALDLIEFANGAADTKWGRLRADMGHPAPFNLKMIGVGNEQWDVQYIERYKAFVKVLKEKYPQIKIVTGSGPSADGEMFDFAWGELKTLKADLVDEHYYQNPSWFLNNSQRYDKYDRNGPKVFAGEYAAQSKATCSPDNKNTWLCALSEAAFMTGLERNAAVVQMASYAPLFAHTEAWQWAPNMIWFDNLKSYGTTNYYVQKMFSNNKGTSVVPALKDGQALVGKDSLYLSSVIDAKTNEVIIKIVNASSTAKKTKISLEGVKSIEKNAKLQVLSSKDLNSVNSLEQPTAVSTIEKALTLAGKQFEISSDALSFTIVKVKYK